MPIDDVAVMRERQLGSAVARTSCQRKRIGDGDILIASMVASTDIGPGLTPVSSTRQQGAKSDAKAESIVRSPASRNELIMYVPLGR